MDALTRQLQDGITKYIGSQRYSAVLDSISRFHDYSVNNSIIIGLQNPQATHVADFHQWSTEIEMMDAYQNMMKELSN